MDLIAIIIFRPSYYVVLSNFPLISLSLVQISPRQPVVLDIICDRGKVENKTASTLAQVRYMKLFNLNTFLESCN
jgi:hypothetical protein